MSFLMSDILTTIRDLAAMEIEDLGSDSTAQNAAIFRFTTVVLRKRARQAYIVETSDALTISGDGYQTFLKDAVAVQMYEPLAIYGPSGSGINKRTSWDAPVGWFRESENNLIHAKSMTGSHTLKYLKYPEPITASTDTVDFPLAAQMDIIMDVVSLVKLIKNYYEESNAIKAKATGTATEKATINARGQGNFSPPSLLDKEE